jgi:hypothetical protein
MLRGLTKEQIEWTCDISIIKPLEPINYIGSYTSPPILFWITIPDMNNKQKKRKSERLLN